MSYLCTPLCIHKEQTYSHLSLKKYVCCSIHGTRRSPFGKHHARTHGEYAHRYGMLYCQLTASQYRRNISTSHSMHSYLGRSSGQIYSHQISSHMREGVNEIIIDHMLYMVQHVV